MVAKRYNLNAGAARANLQRWQAAAQLISGAVRRWLDRRALARSLAAIQRGIAAVVRLQALWRARPLRRSYQRMHASVLRMQVCHHPSHFCTDLLKYAVQCQGGILWCYSQSLMM